MEKTKKLIVISKIIVGHCDSLCGSVAIGGSKNSALPVMAACLMVKGEVVIQNVPRISDVDNMAQIIQSLGGKIVFDKNTATINCTDLMSTETSYDISGKLRASFLVAGPLVALYKRARVSLPGGCSIGLRPVDLHLRGFEALGAKINRGSGFVEIAADKLTGNEIYLDFPSVGATQNIMMAACLAEGVTTISNAAEEPEITDLAEFLNRCGAKITGAGTDKLHIEGVNVLNPVTYKIIPDRIEAGTFMTAVAATGGNVILQGVNAEHLKPVTSKLCEMGAEISEEISGLNIKSNGRLKASSVRTMPFPGFPTDMQSQFCALLSMSEGSSTVTETVFENRFMCLGELSRMNARIMIDGRTAHIDGVSRLTGAKVSASDLRGGAALIVAALGADGITEIDNAHFVYRGYDDIVGKLKNIGANIYTG